ncbi:MAG: hypothetical protein AAB429_03580 [Patescibacteria group bacterium]
MPTDLEQSIFRAVAFFSLFEYPLTGFEVWKWLAGPQVAYRLEEVLFCLAKSPWLADRLETQDGFFVRRGQLSMILTRHARFLDATRKFKRLRRACRYLAFLPMVKMLAVCNTMAWMNTKPESDIDLFVVVKPGRMWTARAFVVLPFALLGRRPKIGAVDPLCFSFFASTDAVDLRVVRLGKEDWYLAQWVRSLVPMADRNQAANVTRLNDWAAGLFPNSYGVAPARPRRVKTWKGHPDLGRLLEPVFRRLQKSRLPAEIQSLANKDSRVIVSDQMLKFHPNDRRAEFSAKLEMLTR